MITPNETNNLKSRYKKLSLTTGDLLHMSSALWYLPECYACIINIFRIAELVENNTLMFEARHILIAGFFQYTRIVF